MSRTGRRRATDKRDSDRVTLDTNAIAWDANGLVTAVVQDATTDAVLMVGHMNAESLRRTLAGPHVWFWSRSRQELWEKGATSGNFLDVVAVTADCDGDALLVRARPHGPTCHTGRELLLPSPDDRAGLYRRRARRMNEVVGPGGVCVRSRR